MYLYVKNKRAFAMIILFPITNSTMLSYANLEKGYSTNIDKNDKAKQQMLYKAVAVEISGFLNVPYIAKPRMITDIIHLI